MANLRVLSDHRWAAGAAADGWRLPDIVRTREGGDFHRDVDGGFWRALTYIDGTHSLAPPLSPVQAGQVGRALGRFHALAAGLDASRLEDTLPGFHIAPAYLAQFDRVRAEALGKATDGATAVLGLWEGGVEADKDALILQPADRTRSPDHPELQRALAFVEGRRHRIGVLEEAREQGWLPLRVIHGDPKLDNVLFCNHSGRAVSLIDLDTVKPGLIHYDLGDCLRSCCNRASEAGDPGHAGFDTGLARAILEGYVAEARPMLDAADFDYIYEATRLLPLELGLRFLTDHLAGDIYFKVEKPGQNLHRALLQFRLAASVEAQEGEIREMVAGLRAG
jgi:Ser/Thr protein kinase RdoA (MazF antagonist)